MENIKERVKENVVQIATDTIQKANEKNDINKASVENTRGNNSCEYCGYSEKGNANKDMKCVPIQTMECGLYGYIYSIAHTMVMKYMPIKSMNNMANISGMQNSNKYITNYITKEDFDLISNDCMCQVMSHEKEYMKYITARCRNYGNDLADSASYIGNTYDRAFCKNCSGLLKSVIEIALITELVNDGCAFCKIN